MPLIKSKSKKAFEKNVEAEMRAGKPKDQSLAISYSVQRRAHKAKGGPLTNEQRRVGTKRMYAEHETRDSETGPTGYRNRNKSSDYSGGQKRGPEGYPKYQEQAQNEKGVHTPVSGVTAFPGGKGTSVAGDYTKDRYAGKPTFEAGPDHPAKKEHARVMAESKKIKPKLQGLAEGGEVMSAKTEKRPMPNDRNNDRRNISENSNKKELYDSNWTDQPTLKQARNPGLKGTKIKHPKMVKSDVLQVRMRDEEDDLQDSAGTNEGSQRQPPAHDNEEDATRRGKSPEKQTAISTGKKVMAEGGKVTASDYDDTDPNAATDSDMHLTPSEDEGEETAKHHNEEYQRQTSGDPDRSKPHLDDIDTYMYAEGGDVQPQPEANEEHHDSIVAAIMANRAKAHAEIDSGSRDLDEAARMASGGTVSSGSEDMNYAEGGQVDLEHNAKEQPNEYPPMNGEALDWDEDADYLDSKQPADSNETGDDIPSDEHDMVSSIRRKMKSKRYLSEM